MKKPSHPSRKARPRSAASGVREQAQANAPEALEKLVELIGSDNERVALSAAQAVLDPAHGKVAQAMSLREPEAGRR